MAMFFTGASANTFKYNGALSGIPATCAVGDLAFITDATAGQQIYECSATNTWTQQLNGGGGAPSGAATGDLGSNYPNPKVVQAHWTQKAIVFASSPYTVLTADSVITCDASGGPVVINLPAATGSGRQIIFKKIDSGSSACTVTRAGSDLIDGATTYGITAQYAATAMVDTVAGVWAKVSPSTPTGWSATSGNWTTGNDNLLTSSTRTCGAATTCGLFSTSATSTAVAGSDIRLSQIGGTVTGGANTGSTWATHYDQVTYNVTSGTALSHGLHDIQRATFTSTAGSPITLGATGYYTLGLVNANAAAGDYQVIHAEWDGSLSGTGALTNGLATIAAGVPGAITGSPTIPYFTSFLAGDPTVAGVPGTVKCGLSIGNPSTAGTYGICIPTPAGTYTNSILTGSAPNWFSGGLLTGPLQSFHGSLSTNTKIEVAGNSTDAMIGYYNANGGLWEAGIGSSANGEFIIKDTANSVTTLLISKSTGTMFVPGNKAFVNSSEFTTSGSGTALEAITGLSFTMPTNTAENVPFSCYFIYHQNAGTAAVAFGVKNSVAPTSMSVQGSINTSATAFTAGNLLALASTTATAVVSATPSVITTNWNAELHGFVENPSGAANTITFLVSTATAADTVTIKRGSYCVLGA